MIHEYTNEQYDSYKELRDVKKRAYNNYVPYPHPQWKDEWRKDRRNKE